MYPTLVKKCDNESWFRVQSRENARFPTVKIEKVAAAIVLADEDGGLFPPVVDGQYPQGSRFCIFVKRRNSEWVPVKGFSLDAHKESDHLCHMSYIEDVVVFRLSCVCDEVCWTEYRAIVGDEMHTLPFTYRQMVIDEKRAYTTGVGPRQLIAPTVLAQMRAFCGCLQRLKIMFSPEMRLQISQHLTSAEGWRHIKNL